MKNRIITSSPGRVDFLNTHQDYKGLPVVTAAINLRTYLLANKTGNTSFKIRSLNLERKGEDFLDSFETQINDILPNGFFGNYFRSVVNVLVKQGF